MADGVEVSAVREEEFETLLPLIAAYQRFYEVDDIDTDRNRSFFHRFLAPSDDGLLLAARDETGTILGYACLYWHFSSLQALETVLMNDLFVVPETRGRGVGRALIEATAAVARERRAAWVEWSTAPDNHTAQRLYDSLTEEKSTWLSYELDV
ncbi:MAG TPA: GNAT family N-acetyltransferase [Solirubrobacterales bacterium]|nr:GNAT family N-acetyltransferase [Solirubrobacterales bacterium]